MKGLILVGFMGCGKSVIGKKIAKKLNLPFVDSDLEIERLNNLSVGDIFNKFGESSFRNMEKDYIKSLMHKDSFVLATGGGMPCFKDNMQLLNQLGTTYYLCRSAKELYHRLKNAKIQRPLLSGLKDVEILNFIDTELVVRDKFYNKSHVILNREDQTPERIILLNHLINPPQKG